MFLSVFDIFKIGIGPSSSNTMGPMTAAAAFLHSLQELQADTGSITRIDATLYGSLAFTGKGHATDRAVILGLMGFEAHSLDAARAEQSLSDLDVQKRIASPGLPEITFDPETNVIFDYGPPLELHPNGMKLTTLSDAAVVFEETYYSIGGGFVMTEAELVASESQGDSDLHAEQQSVGYSYPFGSAAEMLEMGAASGLTIAQMKRANEVAVLGGEVLSRRLDDVWQAMNDCIERGLRSEGELPGGLKVKRRARAIHQRLLSAAGSNTQQPHVANDWLSVYAMAVNEENAAGGRVVTSPTNGAAGVMPAVIRYYLDHCIGVDREGVDIMLLTAAAIGGLIKHNASISGAECGCQAEVGSASAMAAAGHVRCARRQQHASRECRRNRPGTPSRHDLRPGQGPGPGPLHRAQRPRRHQGGVGGVAGLARRRQPLHAAR